MSSSANLPVTFVKDFHDENSCKRMEYRAFGRTGIKVSKISLGCGTLSDFYGDLDLKEAIKTIHQAIRSGINYIDTAPYYGQGRSEEVLGMALRSVPRQAYYIATKVGRYERTYENMFDYSATKTRASVEKSLKLLGLDYVDVVQIHDIEFADLDVVLTECLPELEKLVQEGKIKWIGVSAYPLARLKECIERAPSRFQTVLAYARNTIMDNTLEEYMSFFAEADLAVICASGHAMGLLTNSGPQPWHPASAAQKELCLKAANICKENDIELGKLAMFHFMQLCDVSTYLTGMQTRQLLDINLAALHDGLTQREQEILTLLRDTIFTKPTNWEGYELEQYRNAMAEVQKK